MQCNAMFNKLRFENTIKTVLKVKTVSLICRIIILIQFNLMYSFNSKKDKYTVLTILHQNDFFKPFFGGHPYFRGFGPHEHQFFKASIQPFHPSFSSNHPCCQMVSAAFKYVSWPAATDGLCLLFCIYPSSMLYLDRCVMWVTCTVMSQWDESCCCTWLNGWWPAMARTPSWPSC